MVRYGTTMSGKGPGRHYREGITLVDLCDMFPDDDAAEQWFEKNIWGDKHEERECPKCGCPDTYDAPHKTMRYRCRQCLRYFSVKVGTVMESSKLGYRKWAIAVYQFATNVKGISSMKLHRDLGIGQKAAWFMVHRLRESWKQLAGVDQMEGPVEVDEVYLGGLEKNKHASKRVARRQGGAGKQAVVGIKDRLTGIIRAVPVPETTQARLTDFIHKHIKPGAKIYTDDNVSYRGLPNHESVNHSAGEYVRDQVHINGMESFWALLRRGYNGIFHHLSKKHLHRYVNEFAGRLHARVMNTIDMMREMARGMVGKRLTYEQLIA